jgi:hypothetical protein
VDVFWEKTIFFIFFSPSETRNEKLGTQSGKIKDTNKIKPKDIKNERFVD